MTYTIEDQQYGASVIDIYMPYWSARPWPCVFSIHGGGWAEGSEDSGPTLEHAKKLVDHGMMVVSVRYRLAPEHRWPVQMQDVCEAVNFILSGQYRSRIGKYGIIGASAGAHIAAMITSVWDPAPAVLLYGPYDLPMWSLENPALANQYLPGCFGGASHNESPINRIPPAGWMRPVLLVHGKQDTSVAYQQSERYYSALASAGGNPDLLLVDGDHCLIGSSEETKKLVDGRILDFFTRNLKSTL